jgi:hypothetical protein
MLADEMDQVLMTGPGPHPIKEVVGVFGDLLWDTKPETVLELQRRDPAVIYSTNDRYVALQRFPDGVRFFAGPAPLGAMFDAKDPNVWDVGVLPDVAAACDFVRDWLKGLSTNAIAVKRRPAPWSSRGQKP